MDESMKKAMDEAWEKFKEDNPPRGQALHYYKDNQEYWKSGWESCLEYLGKAAPEFDRDVTAKAYSDYNWPQHVTITQKEIWINAALWMFDQDKARIALAESREKGMRDILISTTDVSAHRIADLESKLSAVRSDDK